MSEPPFLEGLLRRDRIVTVLGLATLWGLSWVYILQGGGLGMGAARFTGMSLLPHKAADAMPMPSMPMDHAAMAGMSAAPLGPQAWGLGLAALVLAMWWIMMGAMMTPSAAPAILLYGRVRRRAQANQAAAQVGSMGVFAAGYALAWLGFAGLATAAQWGLEQSGLLSTETMASQSRLLSSAVLGAAGLYQLSPLQSVCLAHCRSPAAFFARHWRPQPWGSLRLGLLHGLYCVGCCWMLMALLFVGGVMNILWIAALSALVLAEKLLPGGRWITKGSGVLLLLWAAATLIF